MAWRYASLALLAAMTTHSLGQGDDDGRASPRCTNSMSLIQSTSSKTRTILSDDSGEDDFLNLTVHKANSSWAALEAARGRALFQTAVRVTHQATSLLEVRVARVASAGYVTLSFLILAVLIMSIVAAFLLTRPDLPTSKPKQEGKDHLRLPANALTHPRGSKAYATSPVQSRTPTLLAQPSPTEAGTFCPDLVVPRGCECVLLVPIVPLSLGPFSVCDPNGHVVLRVVPKSSANPPSPDRGRGRSRKSVSFGPESLGSAWRLELTTGSGELLAQSACCKTGRAPTSPEWSNQPAFALMRADGAHHATLQRNNEEGYELSAPDRSMFFWGSFDHHAVNITDEGGKLLATSELCSADWDPTGEFYRLRVAPLVDVGLLLCSLVCIDQVAALGRRT